MHSPLAFIKKSGAFGGLSLLLIAGPAVADIPANLADINYQSLEWGGEQLQVRGYTFITSDYHDGKTHEYWWNGHSKTCVNARHDGMKYETLKTTAATDCNQYSAQSRTSGNKDNDNAAAAAIAAAAILGAAALAHKSHQRDDKYNDSQSMAEFDRGYRDGLHHQSYHNYQNTQAYSDGYNTGQRERSDQTGYRNNNNGRYSGYHPYVSLDDLVGANAASADSALRQRGFSDTGGYKQDNKSFVTWYNSGTHQCVQAVTKDGRIKHIDAIDEGNCR